MIGKLSERLTCLLIRRGQIDTDEHELYTYGFFVLLSNLFFCTVACSAGIVVGVPAEALLFYAAFRSIRRYAGGYHAKTELHCRVLSCTAIILAILIIKGIKAVEFPWLSVPPVAFGTAAVLCFAPLDTAAKPLDAAEYKQFRKKSLWILLGMDILYTVSFIFQLWFLCLPVSVALGVETVLLCSGKISERRRKI